jgi:hypothetical protein
MCMANDMFIVTNLFDCLANVGDKWHVCCMTKMILGISTLEPLKIVVTEYIFGISKFWQVAYTKHDTTLWYLGIFENFEI